LRGSPIPHPPSREPPLTPRLVRPSELSWLKKKKKKKRKNKQ
jgi:hypothetical protein